ncbi:bactofilin family protein [Kushneria phyllosphaerae]|uniref:Polymer-forming cytoskeletal n=1 Tax=Kushneria phyllosphaerae TaxID=2100822 RepID=A0A2R8CMZ9_9GAMM|nr:polymer-forming cytoskeletal protein [Kushneria phyllosphaerae]SPJ34212.1 hypothetical protein KSP9073_02245 [Kushneria phyllosphaerae]
MGTVNWLILLATVAGVMIVLDGLRRAHRDHGAGGQSSGLVKVHDGEEARAQKETQARTTSARTTSARTTSVSTARNPVMSEVVSPELPEPMPAPSRQRSDHECSLIGATLHVLGRIEADEHLIVAGRVEGDIHAQHHCVTLLAAGRIGPSVQSQRLIASGTLCGDIVTRECDTFHWGASFSGQLNAARLACDEGVQLNGRCYIGTVP